MCAYINYRTLNESDSKLPWEKICHSCAFKLVSNWCMCVCLCARRCRRQCARAFMSSSRHIARQHQPTQHYRQTGTHVCMCTKRRRERFPFGAEPFLECPVCCAAGLVSYHRAHQRALHLRVFMALHLPHVGLPYVSWHEKSLSSVRVIANVPRLVRNRAQRPCRSMCLFAAAYIPFSFVYVSFSLCV